MAKTLYRTIAEQVADLIRSEIITNEIEEDTLLKEQELSDRFEVSRGTIRHALMQLVAEGIVTSTPNIGMKVASYPTEVSLSLIIEIRNRMEEFVLRKVFVELRENNLTKWKSLLHEIKVASDNDDLEALVDADIRFHRFFMNLYPDKHIRDLWEDARARMMMRYDRLIDMETRYGKYRLIYDAVEKGNVEEAVLNLHSNVI